MRHRQQAGPFPLPTGRPESILAVAADGRTYRRLGYLLLALPLGVAYFAVLATGFVLGTGLFVTLIGVPILLAVVGGSWRLTELERRLVSALLGQTIPAAEVSASPTSGVWGALAVGLRDRGAVRPLVARTIARLVDPATYRGLIFLVAKLPLGLVSFAAIAACYGLALGLLLAPLTYRLDGLAIGFGLVPVDNFETAVLCFLGAPPAILAAMHVSNALAALSARFAHLMLAPME